MFWLDVSKSLIGTAAGAWLAFWVQSLTKKRQKTEDEIAAMRNAVFALGQMRIHLTQFKTRILDPHRSKPSRHYFVVAAMPPMERRAEIQKQSVMFLVEKGEFDLLNNLLFADDHSQLFWRNQALHADFHRNEVQPVLKQHLGRDVVLTTPVDFSLALGGSMSATLERYVNVLYEQNDGALKYVDLAIEECRRVTERLYPGKIFPCVKVGDELKNLDETQGLSQNTH